MPEEQNKPSSSKNGETLLDKLKKKNKYKFDCKTKVNG